MTSSLPTNDRLRLSGRRLAEAEGVGGIGTWHWEPATDGVTWSEGNYRIFGLSHEQVDGTHEAVLARVHPEDVGATRETARRTCLEYTPAMSPLALVVVACDHALVGGAQPSLVYGLRRYDPRGRAW